MSVLWAVSPILLSIVLLVGLRWPAARAMPVCAVAAALVSGLVWQVPPHVVGAALIEAGFITVSILLILFGAVWLMEQLTAAGALETLHGWLSALTNDRLLQAVLIGWVVGSFFEGAAGFGAPAVITAPLLVALGFPPLAAVATALIGDSVAVSFGAVGTPFLVGMAEGLPSRATITPGGVAQQLVVYDLLVGPLMPVLLVWTIGLGFGGSSARRACIKATPFAFVIGLTHLGATAASVHTLGLELPSLAGPLLALIVALLLLRKRWLVPNEAYQFSSEATAGEPPGKPHHTPPLGELLAAVAAYGLLVCLLVVTRLPALGLKAPLAAVSFGVHDVLGTGISADIRPLYSPFAAFVLVTLATPCWLRRRPARLRDSARSALRRVALAGLPLLAAVATVRVFIHSGGGDAGLPPMPMVVAGWLSSALGSVWPLFAPWLGALGAFISGSATFSNLLFTGIQHSVAEARAWPVESVLALQSMGAAAGNMVCVHNVVAAAAAVGLVGRESAIILRTALPMALYLLLAGLLVWLQLAVW